MEFPVGNEKGRKLRSASEKKASQPVGRLLFTRRERVGDPASRLCVLTVNEGSEAPSKEKRMRRNEKRNKKRGEGDKRDQGKTMVTNARKLSMRCPSFATSRRALWVQLSLLRYPFHDCDVCYGITYFTLAVV